MITITLQQLRYAVTLAECNSMNKAAAQLFISQPSLSASIKEIEDEIGIPIFLRNNRGVIVTPEGNEFLGYARQVLEQYRLIDEIYIEKKAPKMRFGVSLQHYSFAVKAFVDLVKQFDMDEYEFAIHETKTYEVIEHVKSFHSEIGILFLSEVNEQFLRRVFSENNLEFIELFECSVHAYLWKGNPLAEKKRVSMADLQEYPCLIFDQGENNAFFLSEEILSTYHFKRSIKANDRATMLNLMVGLNGYTLCSGIINEELNGSDFIAIPLEITDKMTIGYVKRNYSKLSYMAELYIEELLKHKKYAR